MKKGRIINSDISRVVAQMGHFDTIAIGDAGMPVPKGTEKIDLAVTNNVPSFNVVLQNVLTELAVQKIYLAEEIKTANPGQLQAIKNLLPDTELEFISHDDMKHRLADTHAFIRTGEMAPYANIILESGVTF
ncbi:D-ribose pyranase [Periweissella ghanensis]|uniref:D-ribose pyranase n=1 Tax=Periweissella ghanensis TaxID=467997 RepID=A0ABM8ZAK3_9LACO|nr:D-ribose pyranase [Periweissella ghanensis]MCM0600574.1 D-ribose pyranase [Periweissella ghanensis]CAH0418343.1 D-ribose pyranase [Periweissella ghanensis]